MIWVYIAAFFCMGAIIGIFCTMRWIENAITKADLCSTDKNMIRDVLGCVDRDREESLP